MATLVLGTVGTLLGGPIGGALGALAGQAIDRVALAPKGRQGPRLGDLSVQTSSYGNALPRLFGTMRAAGTVIWATDLREDRHSAGSAKSGGRTTTYNYSASLAVALSARPILSVGRIWADGKLLRGAGGDWKSDVGAFRLHLGDEDQAADPLIAAAEGIDAAPAHRGLAYAVFETLQLADFGNHIPSFTFEVTADDGDVAAGVIAGILSGGALAGNTGLVVEGFAASGDSVRGALETLARISPMPLFDDGATLRIADQTTTAIDPGLLGTTAETGKQPARSRDRQEAGTLPDAVTLSYYEPARDYQAGLQQARRDGIGRRVDAIDLPAAVSAGTARALAETALARAWRERNGATVRLPWQLLDARAGTLVDLSGGELWRVSGWTLERMALELTLVKAGGGLMASSGADAGRATADPDAAAGATVLAVLDLPGLSDEVPTRPQLWLAAAGTGAGWRRALASLSLDDGASWQAAGRTAPPATMGSAASLLGDGPATLFDRRSTVEVDLLHAGMALAGADDAALVNGANLALLGDELLQFGTARQLSTTRWRLGALARGRRGTEWASGNHVTGERFVLIDATTLLALDVPLAAIGATLRVSATAPGDGGITRETSAAVRGWALRPPPPVHVGAQRRPDGSIDLSWTRRSRAGWTWLDGGDAALGEDGEHYCVELTPALGRARTMETDNPSCTYSAADQAADGAGGAAGLTVAITQLGTAAASDPPTRAQWTWEGPEE